jgi:hypothetical protein
MLEEDRPLYEDINACENVLGKLLADVETAVGQIEV